jgi:hypothetical protein
VALSLTGDAATRGEIKPQDALNWRTTGEITVISTFAEAGRVARLWLAPSTESVCATSALDASRDVNFNLNTGTGWPT